MSAVLDVWIAKPGDASLVDDDEWLVRVFDARGIIFQWAGNTYDNLLAPHAHWAGTIPPGCYVVQAVNAQSGINTDHVIVTVGCEGNVCVRLFVGDNRQPNGCEIKITDVIGFGETVADS